jgi:transcriptional regulator with GAF, ATPase, and Fis domain
MKHFNKLWQALSDREKKALRYLVCINRPASIDTLIDLCDEPAVLILRTVDTLKRKRLVREEANHKGIYSIYGEEIAQSVITALTDGEVNETLTSIVAFYKGQTESPENVSVLADVYLRLGNIGQGVAYILKTANTLYRAGRKEEALSYFKQVINYFEHHEPLNESEAQLFLDSVLGEISLVSYFMPAARKLQLLRKAHHSARKFRKTTELAHVKLALALEFQAARRHATAARYVSQFRRLAAELDESDLYRRTALLMCEFYQWEGRHAEVIRYYESVIGSVDEFGDDERSLQTAALVGYCFSMSGSIARGMGMITTVRARAEARGFVEIMAFADLMSVLCLLEIRKTAEAEIYLKRLESVPESRLNHMVLRGICSCRAYMLCIRDQYEEAFQCHEKGVEHAKALGWTHHPGAWTFEYLAVLESKGFIHKEVNYSSEIERLLKWNDVYMKGVALRYRAKHNMEAGRSRTRIANDLKESEKRLQASGAQIELARTRVMLSDYHRKHGRADLADAYAQKAGAFLSTLDKSLFPDDLRALMLEGQKIEFMAERIMAINRSLGSIRDRSLFFDKVLNAAMEFALATRGAFLVLESGKLSVLASRNFDASLLPARAISTIVGAFVDATMNDREIILPRDGSDSSLQDNFRKAGIISLLGLPADLDSDRRGYLVLENRLGAAPFPGDILPFLRILCTQVSVGWANIATYEEVSRLKERYEEEAAFYKKEMDIVISGEMLVGPSEEMRKILDQIGQVAPTDSAVLILGETGVGKELVARAIHNVSSRKGGPFIPVNLASLPQELVASELFGHEKGAFTGAHELRKGRFELADGGTIFLDEIGDLPLAVQVKLLRVLQEGVFERLGNSKTIRSNFRVIAATHKNLAREAEKGLFRQDLYWRLNVFPIYVPPLRERREDVAVLANHFLDTFSRKMGKSVGRIPGHELKKLMGYPWPGNVRELKHFIERAVILSDGHGIRFSGFDYLSSNQASNGGLHTAALADVERDHIEKILTAVRWQVSGPKGAAAILGLKRTTLLFRMKKLGIKKPEIPDLL